ncbi:CAMK/CAMK1 protein kinase [Saprolegnia parasitica CBS 223.65]|uniref:CAMK/CAMK1 protein kinase n=1 Tax=Saprolegnia parasitica (strain CBS 223.65) TaxID=695850 RepID=A0A067CU39_SAPPC|nr:CAMK/CAMK1 protein kinase [Saprolegnia parasitica CBS 223.65]KDO32760.1 CAMK/CAMK1 protein kinase [Saprolegnia parasitica CBS 223.65]|eukprot:XP_012196424.1 CAMK/CAMK1 protein kinase [Saprolegnia parasitica CBS 223.65]
MRMTPESDIKVYARLPSYNPFVGMFHHAPSAGNRGAAYFATDIVGMAELEERKKFRNHPLVGTFHALPGYYDPLHGLKQFRAWDPPTSAETDEPTRGSASDSDASDDLRASMLEMRPSINGKEFVAIDLDAETNEAVAGAAPRRRRALRVEVPSNVCFHYPYHEAPAAMVHHQRTRCMSDSDTYATAALFAGAKRNLDQPKTPVNEASEIPRKKAHLESARKAAEATVAAVTATTAPPPTTTTVYTNKGRCRSNTAMARLHSDTESRTSTVDDDDDLSLPTSPILKRGSFSESDSLMVKSPTAAKTMMNLLEPIVIPSPNEIVDGYVSTGKGIYRKCGFLSKSTSDKFDVTSPRLSSTTPPAHHHSNHTTTTVLPRPVHRRQRSCPPPADPVPEQHHNTEYVQGAPRLPSNPFVARRLCDDEENQLRLMSISRSIPRQPDDLLLRERPKAPSLFPTLTINPFFIHEKAVTEHYELVGEDQLGDGSYAVVKPAIRRNNGAEVAIKQIHKRFLVTEAAQQAVRTEVEIHLRLQHRNIVRLLEVYETEAFLYLVMAKARHGTLKSLLNRQRRFPEALAAKLAHQIVRGIFFLHESGVVHCDIKPENVLLTDSKAPSNQDSNDEVVVVKDVKACELQVEICDFGLSVKVPDVRFFKHTGDVHKVPFTGLTGSVGYMAPELFESQPYGKPIDLWSVGIMVYEMLTGFQPFYPPSACMNEPVEFQPRAWKKFSPEAMDFVVHLLERDPTKRFTAEQALTHPWFDTAVFAQ